MITPFKWWMGSPLGSGTSGFHGFMSRILSISSCISSRRKNLGGGKLHGSQSRNQPRVDENACEVLGKPTFMPAVPGFVMSLMLGNSVPCF